MTQAPTFGEILRERRSLLGLTQAELARRAGCAPITIRKLEGDSLRPSVQLAELLALALDIPEAEQLAFIRLGRQDGKPSPIPTPTPSAAEIGLEDLSGRAVKGFQLGELIGSGGFGVVYRAVQPSVQRDVAVKIILPRYANHPTFIRRFEAEAHLVARLEHPHIVPLYDYWREPNAAYLIMRLLRGGGLDTVLARGPMPLEVVWRIGRQVGRALAAAHAQGVLHQDIKPANILLDDLQNGYLADFGIAKNLTFAEGRNLTEQNTLISSPAYISPEQIRNEPVRPSSDIYCFGLLLYEMLTGHAAFQGPTPVSLLQQHLNQPLPLLRDTAPDLPVGLDDVLQRTTAKRPQDRFEDMSTLLLALEAVLQPTIFVQSPDVERKTAVPSLTPQEIAALKNPYRGLRAFTESDVANFFGRETLVQELLSQMSDGSDLDRFLVVIGPSGSGKSSLVKAGLLPALRRGGLPGSQNWFIVDLTPGSQPWAEVADALQRVAINPAQDLLAQLQENNRGLLRTAAHCLPDDGETELLLLIDQFEELFTLVEEEAVREAFLQSLVTAVLDPNSRVRIVITLRADFTDRPLQYVDFGELMEQRLAMVLPLIPDELTQAIIRPVEKLGMAMSPELVSTIIQDVGNQPGMLPLLQYALTELFEQRHGQSLTLENYKQTGGVAGALARRADEIFVSLDDARQEAARQLFLRLMTLGEGAEDTRRRVLLAELDALTGSGELIIDNRILITEYGRYRLLTFDHDPVTRGPTVEVAHEALLREWPRLRGWLRDGREDVRRQRLLAQAAVQWEQNDRDESYLLRGGRLTAFEAWAETTTVALTENERRFLQISLTARDERHAAEETRRQRELETAKKLASTLRHRALILTGGLIVAAVLAITALLFARASNNNANLAAAREAEAVSEAAVRAIAEAEAIVERENAQEQTRLTRSRELALAALTVLNQDPELSILLALEGLDATFTKEAEEALHQAVLSSRVRLRLQGHGNGFSAVAFNNDNTRIAATSWGEDKGHTFGTVYVWNAQTGEKLFTIKEPDYSFQSMVFSPDGSMLFLALEGNISGGLVRIIDAETGKFVRALDIMPAGIQSDDMSPALWVRPLVCCLAISPDGRYLTTGQYDMEKVTGTVWDIETGEALFSLFGFGDTNGEEILFQEGPHYSPKGNYITAASANHTATVWDAQTGEIVLKVVHADEDLEAWQRNVTEAKITPDERRLITIGNDGFIKIWDIETGNLHQAIDAPSFILWGLDISPDGSMMATNSVDGSIHLWDVETGQLLSVLKGHKGQTGNVAFSTDGTRLVSVGDSDGNLLVWDITSKSEVMTFSHEAYIDRVSYTQDGKLIASSNSNGSVMVWETESGERILELAAHSGWVGGLDFSPDGMLLATGSSDTAKIWDSVTGELLLTLEGHSGGVNRLAFSPDGLQIATVSPDKTIRFWDSKTGELLQLIELEDEIFFVDYSADGKRVVTGTSNEGLVQVWDLESGEELLQVNSGTILVKPFFSSSGKLLLFDDGNGATVHVVDSYSGEVKRVFDTGKTIVEMSLSPDETTLLVGHSDGSIGVWNLESAERKLTLFSPNGLDQRPFFSPNGKQVAVSSGQEGVVHIYTLDINELVLLARTRLTRDFTSDECIQYLIDDCK